MFLSSLRVKLNLLSSDDSSRKLSNQGECNLEMLILYLYKEEANVLPGPGWTRQDNLTVLAYFPFYSALLRVPKHHTLTKVKISN